MQTTVETALPEFASAQSCTELHTPQLRSTTSESDAEAFPVTYFDRTAHLAQSPQFYQQMTITPGIDKVFEIGPVFRAKPSFTPRHATEFTGIDRELAWIDSAENVMSSQEQMLAHALATAAQRHGERALPALVAEQHSHPFAFLTDFPVSVRPFYHQRPTDNPDVTASFDLLRNGIKITTGAPRRRSELIAMSTLPSQAPSIQM